MKRKLQLVVFAILANVTPMLAQASSIGSGIDKATEQVKSLFTNATNLLYVVCAILALVGAFQCYNKWTSGDPDTTKTVAGWIGGLVFVFVAITILKTVFNL